MDCSVEAAAADAETCSLLLQQMEKMLSRYGPDASGQTVAACREIGLLAAGLCTSLQAPGWRFLLGHTALRSPALAVLLSAGERAITGGTSVLWAHNATSGANGWTLVLPSAPDAAERWCFQDGGQMRQVCALQLHDARAVRFGKRCIAWIQEVPSSAAQSIAGPVDAQGLRFDLAAIVMGCLRRMVSLTLQHAEHRPLFRRRLADFQHIRYRLVGLHAQLTLAENLAVAVDGDHDHPASSRTVAMLMRLVDLIRNECQQICGGSGYMTESSLATSIFWLDWCDTALRRVAAGSTPLAGDGFEPVTCPIPALFT